MHQENNQRQRYLSGGELRSFLTALDEEPNRALADALRFLLMTGARRNEALMAQWNSIDLEKRQWFLPNTKSGKSRFILLNDGAVELLRQRGRPSGHIYVFPGKNVGEYIPTSRISTSSPPTARNWAAFRTPSITCSRSCPGSGAARATSSESHNEPAR